jgi:hypothetical protein
MERHLTPVDLDALELTFLAADERARLEAHLGGCAPCARRRQEHDAHVRHFRDQLLDRTVDRLAGRVRRRRPVRLTVRVAPLVVAAAIVLLLVGRPPTPRPDQPVLTGKGAGSLQLFARRGDHVFPVEEGAVLAAGDAIRFFVEPGVKGHVIIGSVDGAGKANIYFPYAGHESAALAPRRRLEVPGSIVLDLAPGPERVYAVFSEGPLRSDLVRQALALVAAGGPEAIRRTRALPLPGTAQATVRFEKVTPP